MVFLLYAVLNAIRVLYHDHCFDAPPRRPFSAVLVEDKFIREQNFCSPAWPHGDQFLPTLFDGDENAIVDFKYSPNPRLTGGSTIIRARSSRPKTKSITAGHQRPENCSIRPFAPAPASSPRPRASAGLRGADLAELVQWADTIDGAQYADAREAVDLKAPALKLLLVIEAAKGSLPVQNIIRLMRRTRLVDIVERSEIQTCSLRSTTGTSARSTSSAGSRRTSAASCSST